jgi:hypothetical protein
MFGPSAAYESLARQPASGGRWAAIRRPVLVAFVIGTATAISATGRVTLGLVLSGAACWSFVPALQVATAALVMRSERARVGPGRRLDLWFMGHGPWSLWTLAAAAFITWFAGRAEWPVVATALLPAVWTAWIAGAFCRTILQDSSRQARRRVAVHQALTWAIVLAYIALASQLWPRFLALIGR